MATLMWRSHCLKANCGRGLNTIAGKAGYFEVLQEQQQLFPAENFLVQTELNQFLALVQLYRALGGGWEVTKNSLK
jgi:outer membrane protein TolC